jgi:hypothetical protein
MNKSATLFTFAIVASVLASSSSLAQHERYRPEVGKPHPEIVLPRIDNGESVSLAAYRGKKVLLIHFASW